MIPRPSTVLLLLLLEEGLGVTLVGRNRLIPLPSPIRPSVQNARKDAEGPRDPKDERQMIGMKKMPRIVTQ